ncbi:hypothetical protein F511_44789 [Dorcoceras hygrometricum]|uniref:Uncharacterized protein n=1 Tax=Dorcoceras hygrometricum TaxID=472368 RepID=A0A2Z7B5H6_9LAMI|nr:hypothetical protein F511_44789 [Dorcoceras hygrometricum]
MSGQAQDEKSVVQMQNEKLRYAQHIAVLVASLHTTLQLVCKLVQCLEAEFEDLNMSADWHLAYFRTRHFLSPSPIPSKPLLFTEHYFSYLPSIFAVVWSKTGDAELILLRSFDCYQLGDLIRRVGGARTNPCVREFLRQLTREFLSSFELLVSSQRVPAVFVEISEEES